VGAAGGRSLRLRREWGSGGRPGRTAKPRVKRRTGDDGGAAEATTTVWTAKKVGGSSGGGQGIVYAPDRNRRAEGKGAVVKTAQTGSRRISANMGAAP
jgi:hypothetical protein